MRRLLAILAATTLATGAHAQVSSNYPVAPIVGSANAGLAPASGGGTTNYLRADGTWAAATGSGGGTVTSVGSGTCLTGGPVTGSGSLALATSCAQAETFTGGVTIGTGASTIDNATIGGTTPLVGSFTTVNLNKVIIAKQLYSSTAPTIASGFGTSPSIIKSNGNAAFVVGVGTGASASSGVLTLPAAFTGWNCFANDETNPGSNHTMESADTTTSVTLTNYNNSGTATAWSASDVLKVVCASY